MPIKEVQDCGRMLLKRKLTIAFAESATAGRLSSEFSLVPDSGNYLIGGLVCYDACLKQEVLGVPSALIDQYTPESAEVTEELAKRLGGFIKSDIQVAVTGLTTPGGSETPDKPVGTMFLHVLIKGRTVAARKLFAGSPEEIVIKTVSAIAVMIMEALQNGD